jgi:hypothetical protein
MLKYISKKFTRLIGKMQTFQKDMHQVEIEAYIKSRNPKNAADIDRLLREYEARSRMTF